MLEDFSWIFVSYVLLAEIDSNQIRDDCVVLSADEIQTDIDWVWKVLLFWEKDTDCVQNSQSDIWLHLNDFWDESQLEEDFVCVDNFLKSLRFDESEFVSYLNFNFFILIANNFCFATTNLWIRMGE